MTMQQNVNKPNINFRLGLRSVQIRQDNLSNLQAYITKKIKNNNNWAKNNILIIPNSDLVLFVSFLLWKF